MIALFVSLGGVSYGVATGFIDSREIKNNTVASATSATTRSAPSDLRNNEVRGIDIRNSTVQGRDIALATITGTDINEVDAGQGAERHGGRHGHLSAGSHRREHAGDHPQTTVAEGAAPGTSVTLATHGPLTLTGRCEDSGGGDTLARLRVDTSRGQTPPPARA